MTEQIQHMQRLQLAGTLAGGIAHDLNNELTLILGNLDLALDQLPAGDEASDSIEHAKSAASRCADMSRRLLAVSRERRPAMTKMDVAAAVDEARRLLDYIKPPRTRVIVETEPGLFIQGDASQIQQAVMNLGTNGFQAMPKGGELKIGAYRKDHTISIFVRDTGCGISAAQRQRIFQPFYTTHGETGAGGLGLSTVRSIVNRHAGDMAFDSNVGKGTVFILNLPAWEPEEKE
jgi:signal transduction histidine kinase